MIRQGGGKQLGVDSGRQWGSSGKPLGTLEAVRGNGELLVSVGGSGGFWGTQWGL